MRSRIRYFLPYVPSPSISPVCRDFLPFDNFAARVSTDLPVPRGCIWVARRVVSLSNSSTPRLKSPAFPWGQLCAGPTCAGDESPHSICASAGQTSGWALLARGGREPGSSAALPSVGPSGRLRPQEPIWAIPDIFRTFCCHICQRDVWNTVLAATRTMPRVRRPAGLLPVSRTATLLVNRSMSLANVSAQMRPRSSNDAPASPVRSTSSTYS